MASCNTRPFRYACLVLCLAVASFAQTPARVTLTAAAIQDGSGNATLASGYLCVMTTDMNDRPMGYRLGSGAGQTTASGSAESCFPVTGGAIAPQLILNSAASSPLNACLRITTRDSSSAEIRRDKCVQTGTAPALTSWCSGSGAVTCNWDQYPIGTTPVALVQVGPTGSAGPPGCTTSAAGCYLNHVLDATTFTAADIGSQINAAFASVSGQPSVKVILPPGRSFQVTTPITLPGSTTGNQYVDFDCQGSSLTGSFSGTMVTILGANANAPNSTGSLHNCTIFNTGAGPVVTVLGRLGFAIRYNNIIGNGDNVQVVNTNQYGGPGYSEEDIISDNGFSIGSPGSAGIHHIMGVGATNSFDYNWEENNHCQLAAGTWCEIFDANEAPLGLNISMHLNTATYGTLDTGGIWVKGAYGLARSHIDMRGEDTAQIGAAHYWEIFGGPSYNDGTLFVTGAGLADGNSVQAPRNPVTTATFGSVNGVLLEDENGPAGTPQRRSQFLQTPNLTLFGLRKGGQENRGEMYWLSCEGNQEHALQATCNTSMYVNATNGRADNDTSAGPSVGIGPGFGAYGVQPITPLHVRGRTSGNGIAVTIEAGVAADATAMQFIGNNPYFAPRRTLWQVGPSDGVADSAGAADLIFMEAVHGRYFRMTKTGFMDSPVGFSVNNGASLGVTKTCNSNIQVVGGIIVSCN